MRRVARRPGKATLPRPLPRRARLRQEVITSSTRRRAPVTFVGRRPAARSDLGPTVANLLWTARLLHLIVAVRARHPAHFAAIPRDHRAALLRSLRHGEQLLTEVVLALAAGPVQPPPPDQNGRAMRGE